MESERKYAIKRPFGSIAVIPYGLLMIGLLLTLLFRINLPDSLIPLILISFAFSVHAAWFITVVIQLIIFKPRHLQLLENAIALYNRGIQAADIDKIVIQGYFFPTIGIVPRGKRFVPTYLCFAFREHDEGMKGLKEWADQHQVEVKAGHYRTWI
ncbi:hypothetical protein [Paenibacillus sp. NPDC057967]|uniref:hypothetical protein n=1 Tax=Paenibacillus sp. NPDC057967 TaxID=3346293 RepID=UPI0036D7AE2C